MRQKSILLGAILIALQLCSTLAASPKTAHDAEMAVMGWLQEDPEPFETVLGTDILNVETFTDGRNDPVYYVVNLYPSGFVIVSADDQVEPIVGFAEKGTYDPSPMLPLGALVTRDVPSRIQAARSSFGPLAAMPDAAPSQMQMKWNRLIGLAQAQDGGSRLMLAPPIRDRDPTTVWVPALTRTQWGQTYAIDRYRQPLACYNYFTPPGDPCDPRNYPCGCVATVMAQVIRFHSHPVAPVQKATFEIQVNGKAQQRTLRGGDGPNGAYNWGDMVFYPDNSSTDRQRRAIGALCHDAGVSIGMSYSAAGSGATMDGVPAALVNTFHYANVIWAENGDAAIAYQDLIVMINSNLDADLPVALAILEETDSPTGHAIVCDGYGYQATTLYHHLNMGWYGYANCWYNLPDIEVLNGPPFRTIFECLYNIYPEGKGEIVSGRVVDVYGYPLGDAIVSARKGGAGPARTDTTSRQGVYGIRGLDPNSTYTLTVSKAGYDFEQAQATTGSSRSGRPASGNRWGVNFVGRSNHVTVTIGTGTSEWGYPLHTSNDDSRTQVIYLAEEIGMAGAITSLALDVARKPGQSFDKWTIRMKHTTAADQGTSSLDAEGWTVVYQKQNVSINTEWQRFDFQTPFEYNGRDNLLVDFSHDNSRRSADGNCRASRPGGARSVYAGSDSGDGDPLQWSVAASPSVRSSNYVPNVMLTLGLPSKVLPSVVKLTPSTAAESGFGSSVSISGDYAIVGTYNSATKGAAYIFNRDGSSWVQQAKLSNAGATPSSSYGRSVSICGDYAVVGEAAAFSSVCLLSVYKREGAGWAQPVVLMAPDNPSTRYYRPFVSVFGDRAIIGTNRTARVFKCNDSSWIEEALLLSGPRGKYDYGYAVSVVGDYAAVGRPEDEDVYLFGRSGTGWTQQATLSASDGAMFHLFGHSVSMDGEWVVIGAPGALNAGGANSGAFYVSTLGGGLTKFTASDGEAGDNFGYAVCVRGDYIIVGAPEDDDQGGRNCGSAYMFKRQGTTWVQQTKLTAIDGVYDDFFGCSVSIDGDYVIAGAKGNDSRAENAGAAYIFKRAGDDWGS